jgi:hypothetical protein
LPDLDGMVRLQGIAFPASHGWSRCRVPLTYKRGSSPIISGGGGPYRTVRTRCESGVRIKNSWIRIQESGSRCICIQFDTIRGSGPRPDPESFAFSVLMNFFMDPDPRIWIRVRVTPNSFRKILNMIFWKKILTRAYLWVDPFMFYILASKKIRYPVWGLRRVRPRTCTVVRCGTAQQRTTDPASASGSAFRTVRYASAF